MQLTADMILDIDAIQAAAQGEGRSALYEQEVYGILRTIGRGYDHEIITFSSARTNRRGRLHRTQACGWG